MDKIYLDWDDISRLTNKIIKQIAVKPEFIIGIPRGGLIPAVIIAHKLDIKCLSLHELETRKSDNFLIIDDIADTGKTLEKYSEYPIATLFYKPQSIIKPDYYGREVDNNSWLVFPWELITAEPIADYLKIENNPS